MPEVIYEKYLIPSIHVFVSCKTTTRMLKHRWQRTVDLRREVEGNLFVTEVEGMEIG